MANPRLTAWFEDYADGHRHPMNRLTHKVAIPLIVFHILAMLDWIPLVDLGAFTLTGGHVGWLVATVWYTRLDVRLGLIMSALFGATIPLGWYVPAWAVVAIAAFAWLVQLAGHRVWEKNRPSFVKNIQHALVGPLFFVALLTGDWPAAELDRRR